MLLKSKWLGLLGDSTGIYEKAKIYWEIRMDEILHLRIASASGGGNVGDGNGRGGNIGDDISGGGNGVVFFGCVPRVPRGGNGVV